MDSASFSVEKSPRSPMNKDSRRKDRSDPIPQPQKRASNFLDINFYVILAIGIIGGPAFTISAGIVRTWKALIVSFVIASLCGGEWLLRAKTKCSMTLATRTQVFFLFQCLALSLTFPTFYLAIADVVAENNLPMHDQTFLEADEFILGWLFPKGQLSLWVDSHPTVNPSTFLGKLILEFLQIVYVSYFFWGYLLMIWLLWKCFSSWWKEDKKDSHVYAMQLKVLMCAWFSSYLLTFLGNLAIPGISPRIYIKNYFTHTQDGFGFSYLVAENLKRIETYATFPSGHVGETFVVALVALKITPSYGKLTSVIAFLVAMATLWCRYHYLIDVICTIPIIILACMFGMILPSSCYRSLLSEVSPVRNPPELIKIV